MTSKPVGWSKSCSFKLKTMHADNERKKVRDVEDITRQFHPYCYSSSIWWVLLGIERKGREREWLRVVAVSLGLPQPRSSQCRRNSRNKGRLARRLSARKPQVSAGSRDCARSHLSFLQLGTFHKRETGQCKQSF